MPEQPSPDGRLGLGQGCRRLIQPLGDRGRDGRLRGVGAEHFLDGGKFAHGRLLRLLLAGGGLRLFLRLQFRVLFHGGLQAECWKCVAKTLRARCNFPRTASLVWPVSAPTSS